MIREYVLKNYPKRFKKRSYTMDQKGKKTWKTTIVEPIIMDCGSHWDIRNHPTAGPLILSKNI